ncbi:MAG: hypothetical protein HY331_06045 [Chloroflexi bacterium]|nr:hypothetical protein [Chloroflexota bacterium]
MRLFRVAAFALALLLAVPAARPAFAGFAWCEGEPNVRLQINGKTVDLNVWVGVPLDSRRELGGLSLNQQQVTATVVDLHRGSHSTTATIRVTTVVRSATGRPFPVRLRLGVPAVGTVSEYTYGENDSQLTTDLRVVIPDHGRGYGRSQRPGGK